MNQIISLLLFTASICLYACQQNKQTAALFPADANKFSEKLISTIKSDEDYSAYQDTLEHIDLKRLDSVLSSQYEQIPFWINIYNSLILIKGKANPESYSNRELFFNDKDIVIGQTSISLNQIENNILRRQKDTATFSQLFQVDSLDYRIHFALNCGAAACPPILFYSPDKINSQLNLAEDVFVELNADYSKVSNNVEISELFNWYATDFGGTEGILHLLKAHQVIPNDSTPQITFSEYDWTPSF